jgi:molecular chaperone DnaK (HSP70)
VAEGAAMYAAYLDDPNVFGRNIEVKTRTCHALGVETKDGVFHEVIPRNRKTPCEKSCIYSTSTDNMTSLDINVYQGSSRLVKDNSLIGTVSISDLAERPAGELNIEVIFKLDSESNLSVIVEVDGRRWVSSFKFT